MSQNLDYRPTRRVYLGENFRQLEFKKFQFIQKQGGFQRKGGRGEGVHHFVNIKISSLSLNRVERY